MTLKPIDHKNPPTQVERWVAMGLLIQFALVCTTKLFEGLGHELLWMSHVALLVGGVGLFAGWNLLTCTALISVLIPHAVWLGDAAGLALLGDAPLGITRYLQNADVPTWLATAHHFYLAPLLWWMVVREHRWHGASWICSSVLLLYLLLISRTMLPPQANVNYAYELFGSVQHPLLNTFNRLPASGYLLTLHAMMALLVFAPTAMLIRGCLAWSKSRNISYA